MTDKNTPYVKGMIWIGLFPLLAGGAMMVQSIRVGMTDETPSWLGVAFGLMFFNAGLTVMLMDMIFNVYRERKWFAYFQVMAMLSIFLIFPLLFNWVAFGPGEREFSMSISIPFLSFDGLANKILGRAFFAIPALLMDAVIGYLIYAFVVDAFWKKRDENINAFIEEMESDKKMLNEK